MSDPAAFSHEPVMRDEIVDTFAGVPAGYVLDATLGGGGHSEAILESRDDLRILGVHEEHDRRGGCHPVLGRSHAPHLVEQALRDPAYAQPDDYVGAWGISWLHHWEVTRGGKRSPSPDPPAWILEAHEAAGR